MRLHLIRHAKTKQMSSSGKDIDRELLERGLDQTKELTVHLSTLSDFTNAKVICSTATRTRQTLTGLSANFKDASIEFSSEIYLCPMRTYLETIWTQKHANDLVFIGHNFGISDLANYYLDTMDEMKTGEYVCIEFPFDNWEETFQSTGNLTHRFRSSAH